MIPEASATPAALEAGLATHEWDMFEARVGDVAEAVEIAIRAALEAAAPHMACPKTHGHPDAQYVCMAKAGHDGND